MDVSALCVAADTLSLFELSHFTFLHSANMFTQCHGACLQSCLLVYLMAGMLAQRVDPMRVMATMKTEAFWWPSRRRGHDGGGGGGRGGGHIVPCWTVVLGRLEAVSSSPTVLQQKQRRRTWWAEQMEVKCRRAWAVTDKALHPLVCWNRCVF